MYNIFKKAVKDLASMTSPPTSMYFLYTLSSPARLSFRRRHPNIILITPVGGRGEVNVTWETLLVSRDLHYRVT